MGAAQFNSFYSIGSSALKMLWILCGIESKFIDTFLRQLQQTQASNTINSGRPVTGQQNQNEYCRCNYINGLGTER